MSPDFFDEYEFFTGVPDSLLNPFVSYLMKKYENGTHHIIAANEGNAVGLAAGYFLSTGKIPVVYLQNSGIGNIINPVVSLLNDEVYRIPAVFVIGWRGEPGYHDEPQHKLQGKVTLKLLEDIGIRAFVVSKDTSKAELDKQKLLFDKLLNDGQCVAWVIKKGAIDSSFKYDGQNNWPLSREEVLEDIISIAKHDLIVSTTGKASRELFELREKHNQSHASDFLTVGSMGHNSSIALGIALNKPHRRVWCVDGDGAILMHMGAMATIGFYAPNNFVHVVFNNGSHESVGGFPTFGNVLDITKIAVACGYRNIFQASQKIDVEKSLKKIVSINQLSFLEVKTRIGSRKDLGRPNITPMENKTVFMKALCNN